ncbi:MAG: (R)-2-hydroxyisocaproyl-CoA dehydratase subunit beta [Gammaproteobacteria bacterium]
MGSAEIIKRCESLYEDLDFTAAREWKAAEEGRKVIGYLPVYVPEEIIHAAGMLPLGIMGGGDQLEVIHGDAYYQSYICRIPRSTIELGITKRLDFVDGMLFPSICDVIRNLSGMWKLMFPDVYVRYVDLPQNYRDDIGGEFYQQEMRELIKGLEKLSGRKISDDDIRNSIKVYNENRRLIRALYKTRAETPWKVPSWEVYLLNRAGLVLPVEEHSAMLREYLEAVQSEDRPMKDNCRVIINGSFCEQPPLNLIKSIEMAGCYVVDDDYVLGNRWLKEEVPTTGDPLEALAKAFLHHSADTAAKFAEKEEDVGRQLIESIKENAAEGVIFAAPSFCDPALLWRPMLADRCAENNVPHISFKYAENSGQMAPIREQAGTFADSIKLWS